MSRPLHVCMCIRLCIVEIITEATEYVKFALSKRILYWFH